MSVVCGSFDCLLAERSVSIVVQELMFEQVENLLAARERLISPLVLHK